MLLFNDRVFGPSTPAVSLFCCGFLGCFIRTLFRSAAILLQLKSMFSLFVLPCHSVCGANLTATTSVQYFYSHASHGGQDYGARLNCEWQIRAPPEQCVHLRFTTFELENDNDCGYDYVEVHGTQQAKFCGTRVRDLVSQGPFMQVRLVTDDTISGKGFTAAYITTECNSTSDFALSSNSSATAMANRSRSSTAKWPKADSSTAKGKPAPDASAVVHGPVFFAGQLPVAPPSSYVPLNPYSTPSPSAYAINARRGSRSNTLHVNKPRTRRPPAEDGFIE